MSVLVSRFEFAPSRLAAGLVGCGAVIAVAAVLIIPAPLPLRVLAAAVVAAVFWRAGRRVARLRGEGAVGGVEFLDDGRVAVLDGRREHADIGEVVYHFASPLLITLIVRGGKRRHAAMVMRDSLPADEHRQLRVRLMASR